LRQKGKVRGKGEVIEGEVGKCQDAREMKGCEVWGRNGGFIVRKGRGGKALEKGVKG
jgi:hypothetical protein